MYINKKIMYLFFLKRQSYYSSFFSLKRPYYVIYMVVDICFKTFYEMAL